MSTEPNPHSELVTDQSSVGADPAIDTGQQARIRSAIDGRSFAMLSTVSSAGFPHAAGVQYAVVGGGAPSDIRLYVHTMRSSRKARNIAADDRVAVVIPVRRLPIGPPFTVQFQARAAVVAMDESEILDLLSGGQLKAVSSHGELDEPDGCYLRITPNRTIHTYGIGVSLLGLIRDPLHVGARTTRLRR